MSLEELLLHALVMEREAVQRYTQLAKMMERIGNRKVAKIFAKMSKIEAEHAEQIEDQIGDHALPFLIPSEYRWRGPESPENADSGRLFHLMTPRQAMSLALECERRAHDFFADVVDDSTDECVRELAAEIAAEEEQHVAWVKEWLADL
ncbi:MAG: ferritin family protein [Gammaproteobacteria bacterium]|nr:ferritin family protein [Gammaproteobacteria bacterium]